MLFWKSGGGWGDWKMKREKEKRRCEPLVSAGDVFYSYGLALLAQEWNNGSFPQYMHSEVGSQIITSTWLDTMNETGRGRNVDGGTVEGGWCRKKIQGSGRQVKMDV